LIPCNLALIELLFKLSLIREALLLHLSHYRSMYKSNSNNLNMHPSRSSISVPINTSGSLFLGAAGTHDASNSFGKEQYKFLKAFCRVLEKQLDLQIALVDPMLSRYATSELGSNRPTAPRNSAETLALRIEEALRNLYQQHGSATFVPDGNENASPPPIVKCFNRFISGKSLVSKVQALLLRAEDLISRMHSYQEQYQQHHSLHSVDSGSSSEDDSRPSSRSSSRSKRDSKAEEKRRPSIKANESKRNESVQVSLQDLMRQKEEIKKKIHSFNHAYFEEINLLVKQCLQSTYTASNHDSSMLVEDVDASSTSIPAGCINVNHHMYAINCGLDQLCNKLWDAPLKKDDITLAALSIRAQCIVLLQSIFSTWPGLGFRIAVDPTQAIASPSTVQQPGSSNISLAIRSLNSQAICSGRSVNTAVAPRRSRRRGNVPPPPPIEYEYKHAK
jgi:hypothetical protein